MRNLLGRNRHAPLGRILRKSASPVSHSGNTGETVLATITLPANSMGANGRILVEGRASYSNNARPKTFRVKFGEITYLTGSVTHSKWWRFELKVRNRGATNRQEGSGFALLSNGALARAADAAKSSDVETSEPVDITITAELANAADKVTLEVYQVIVYPK